MTGRLIIVEGVDGSGKTTLIKGLAKELWPDYIWHFSAPEEATMIENYAFEKGMFFGLIPHLKILMEQDKTVICDRFHFSTWAYGPVMRGYSEGMADGFLEYVEDLLVKYIRPIAPIKVLVLLLSTAYSAFRRNKVSENDYLSTIYQVDKVNSRYFNGLAVKSKLPVSLILTDVAKHDEKAVLEWAVKEIVGGGPLY